MIVASHNKMATTIHKIMRKKRTKNPKLLWYTTKMRTSRKEEEEEEKMKPKGTPLRQNGSCPRKEKEEKMTPNEQPEISLSPLFVEKRGAYF